MWSKTVKTPINSGRIGIPVHIESPTSRETEYRIAKVGGGNEAYYYAEYRAQGCQWKSVEPVFVLYGFLPQQYREKCNVIKSIEDFKVKSKKMDITYEAYNG
jgi:hypothetical protein